MADADWSVDATLAAGVDDAACSWAQGDVFENASIVRLADASMPLTADAARASERGATGAIAVRVPLPLAVLVSQTCDVVRTCRSQPFVRMAMVVNLDGDLLGDAARGWKPRYVPLPWLSGQHFADLDLQGTVEKSALLGCARVAHCTDGTDQLRFARRIGRHSSRFAFPDDLSLTLGPLVKRIRDKSGQPTPQGRRVDEVLEIRARATPGWESASTDVELIFIIDPQSLLDLSDADDVATDTLAELETVDAQRLAERLDQAELDPASRGATWQRLVDEWARYARPTGCINSVTAHAVSATDFTLLEHRDSPELDLEYLSE